MNFNDISRKNEDVEKQIDKFIEEKEAMSNIEKLEERTDKTVKLLDQFYENILSMINRMEKAGQYMEIESIQKIFMALSNNTEVLIRNQQKMEESITKFTGEGMQVLRISNDLIKKKTIFFKYINWFLAVEIIIFTFIIFNIYNRLDIYDKNLGKYFIDIHNIIKEDKKYWYDEKNNEIWLKNVDKK